MKIANDVPMPTIQRLGRWSSASVYKYVRESWLENPDDLRAMGKFEAPREERVHLYCKCSVTIEKRFAACPKKEVQRERSYEKLAGAAALGIIPYSMKILHSILIHPREAEPWISLRKRAPADWLQKNLIGDKRLFKVATYLAARQMICLRQTLATADHCALATEYCEVWNFAGNVYRNSQNDYNEARACLSKYDAFIASLLACHNQTLARKKTILSQGQCMDLVSTMLMNPCLPRFHLGFKAKSHVPPMTHLTRIRSSKE